MEGKAKEGGGDKNPICLSDLENFYPLPDSLKKNFRFKKPFPSARDLAQIIFRQKEKRVCQSWRELKAFYLRSPFGIKSQNKRNYMIDPHNTCPSLYI